MLDGIHLNYNENHYIILLLDSSCAMLFFLGRTSLAQLKIVCYLIATYSIHGYICVCMYVCICVYTTTLGFLLYNTADNLTSSCAVSMAGFYVWPSKGLSSESGYYTCNVFSYWPCSAIYRTYIRGNSTQCKQWKLLGPILPIWLISYHSYCAFSKRRTS